jgi:hypothetical protein
MDQDKTINDEMNIDFEVEEDMAHKHDDDGDHHPSQPQALAPVVIEDDQEEVGPEAGRDIESDSDDESDGDCSDDLDGDCSDDDRDSEDGLGSEDGEDTDVDDGYASL